MYCRTASRIRRVYRWWAGGFVALFSTFFVASSAHGFDPSKAEATDWVVGAVIGLLMAALPFAVMTETARQLDGR